MSKWRIRPCPTWPGSFDIVDPTGQVRANWWNIAGSMIVIRQLMKWEAEYNRTYRAMQAL